MTSPRLFKQFFSTGGSLLYTTLTVGALSLPQGTLNVVSTANFAPSGTLSVLVTINSSIIYQTVTYTSINATQFLGCAGGTGLLSVGNSVVQAGSVADGTWTCPAGIKWVIVTGCGGGGGGGGGASSGGRTNTQFAGGGSGGQAAPTSTQIVAVTPGVTYNISIGWGGIGGTTNCVANIVSGGGSRPGNPGSDGASSVFGSVVFTGGRGGREGYLVTLSSLTFPLGNDCANTPISGSANPNPQNIQVAATLPAFTTAGEIQGGAHAVNRAVGQYSVSGGGTYGGVSNNIYSAAGFGGPGAQGFDGYPFAIYGGNGTYGGGGGGAGGGENWDYNNTHDGSVGGAGGAGFIEISWIA